MGTRQVALGEIFSTEELNRVAEMWKSSASKYYFHNEVRDKIVKPALAHINEVLGQPNDPDYIAYMLEALCSHLKN